MQIIKVKNSEKERWNNFVLAHKGEFLQSWEWGEFQAATGKEVWRLAAEENGEIIGAALIAKHNLPLGKNYLYCPRGPALKTPNPQTPPPKKKKIKNSEALKLIFDKIKEIAKKENSIFLKWEPAINNNVIASPANNMERPCLPAGRNLAVSAGNPIFLFRNHFLKSSNLQPHDSLILDLDKTEEEMLAQMKQKTRYNIRLAEKHGVKIRISDKETFESDFKKFWLLTEETTSRDKFQSHPKEYYYKILKSLNGEILSQKPVAKLFLAEFEGKILAANIMLFFGARATYLHGASGAAYRNLMAPYLLQWEQIRKSREFGFKEYDFWGIASINQKSQPEADEPLAQKIKNQNLNATNYKAEWEGITRFKTGFGGQEINYPDAADIVYQPIIYKAIKVAKQIKAILR